MSLTNSPFWMAQTGGASFYDYEIENSFRLDKDSDHYLSRTPASAGNRQKWTLSWWMKRGKIYDGQTLFAWGNFSQNFIFTISGYAGDNSFDYYDYDNGTDRSSVSWSYKVRDPSAWYHMVLRVDTTEGTASNRIRLYINNQQASDSGGRTNYPSQNISMFANNNTPTYIAHDFYGGRGDGYYADVNFIDGQSLDPTSFAETKSGVWVPKEYTGSYGTNGYFLKFQNSAALGTDSSGNSNNFTVNNASSIDQMPDTPTNNFCTMNSAHGPFHGNYTGTFREGNLFWEASGNASHAFATFPIVPQDDNGYYFEVVMDSMDNARTYIGFVETADGPATGNGASYEFNTKGVYSRDGYWYGDSGLTNGIQYTAWVVGDVIMVAYKQGKVWFGKNGTWFNSGNPAAGTGDIVTAIGDTLASKWGTDKTWIPYVGYNSGFKLNFGADSSFSGSKTRQGNSDENGYGDFYYTPPSGFLAMCTQNMQAPAIDPLDDVSPQDYFNTVLWTGTGSGQSITGMGFQPDWLWFKSRNNSNDHALIDSVRGVNQGLVSNSTAAEVTSGASNDLVSFDSDGFTTGTPQNFSSLGSSGFTIATWGWKAGGTGVSNTDGSITSTVSANTDAGFSVVTYTGNSTNDATIGHGLGVAPKVVIVKNRVASTYWYVYHDSLPPNAATYNLYLNTTDSQQADNVLRSTNSTTFTVSSSSSANGSSMVAYCFAEIEGYSKAGSYIGNGSADGAFIYTGFRPAWIMIKRTDSTGSWHIIDDKRIGYNDSNRVLLANSTDPEQTNYSVQERDILSNGFKMRDSNSGTNASGGTYIYLAFAENPFKYANAR
jgi:hypothetical protein